MSRRVAGLFILLSLLLLILGWWRLGREHSGRTDLPAPEMVELPFPSSQPKEIREVWTAKISRLGELRLEPEEVEIESGVGTEVRLFGALASLLEGGDRAPFRGKALVRTLFLEAGGTAYVDLTSADGSPPQGMGSTEELLSVYAVVHTILDNAPEIRRVVLLWNGSQPLTLAGHIDLSRPLVRFESLEAR